MKRGTLALTSLMVLFSDLACTRPAAKSATLRITMPARSATKTAAQQKISSLSLATPQWGLNDPTSVAQLGCYAVFIGAADADLSTDSCSDPDSQRTFKYGKLVGLFGLGDTATADVTSGSARRLILVGMSVSSGSSCESAFAAGGSITFSHYSAPFVVGDVTVDLKPGDNTVVINEAMTDFKLGACSNLRNGGGLKAMLMSNGDVVGPAGSLLSVASNPTNIALAGGDPGGSANALITANSSGQLSLSSVIVPANLFSATRKPDSGQWFALQHDGKVVSVGTSGDYSMPSPCPFKSCQVPVWFQSISAGQGNDLFGLDHAGNLYRMKADGTPEQLLYNFGPNVSQVAFY